MVYLLIYILDKMLHKLEDYKFDVLNDLPVCILDHV